MVALTAVGLVIAVNIATPAMAASLLTKNVRLARPNDGPQIFGVVNGHKYLFRSPSSLASYGYQNIKTEIIDHEVLDKLPRVNLIKSPIGPRVYLFDELSGQKLWFVTEESFIASGARWPDIFEISSFDSRLYPNARLARGLNDSKVYYLDWDNKTKAPIPTPEIFLAKGFLWSEIVAAPDALLAGYTLTNPVDANTLIPEQPPSGAVLSMSGGSGISATTFPANTIRNPVWTIGLSAANGPVNLQGLNIGKRGFLRDTEIDALSILDEKGFLLANPQRLAESLAFFNFKEPLTVSAGGTRTLTITANFAPSVNTAQTTFSLSVADQSQVKANAPVRGQFPLTSATHTVIAAAGIIGNLAVDSVELSSSPRNVVVGAVDQILNRWQLSLSGGSEDALIEKLIFNLIGNGRALDFGFYELVDDQNKIVAKDFVVRGASVMLDFGKNPYRLRRGETKILTLRADIKGGSDNTSQFVIMNDYDIYAKSSNTSYALAVMAGSSEGSFPVGDKGGSGFNAIYVEPGKVLVDLNSQSPSGPITRGARDAVLATFDIKALGQSLRWDKVNVNIATQAPHTPLTESVTIRIKGGAAIGTVDAASVMDRERSVYLSNPPNVLGGKILIIEVVGNVNANASTADRYTVTLSGAEFVVSGSTDKIIFASSVSGAARAVQEITLRARHDPNFKPASFASAGAKNFKIGKYLFQPSAGERIRINQVTLIAVGTTPVRFSDGYSNLKLGGKAIAAPNGNPHIFALATEINAGSEAGFDLVVDTTTAVDGQTIQFSVQGITAIGVVSKTSVPVQLENIATPAIAFKRSKLLFSLNNNFTGGQVSKNTSSIVGSFTVSADGAEDIAVPELTLTEATSSSGLSVTRGYKNLRLTDASNGRTISRTVVNPVSGAGGNLLSGGPTPKPGQTLTFNVVIDSTAAASGDSVQALLSVVKAEGRTTRLAPTITGLPVTGQIVTFSP